MVDVDTRHPSCKVPVPCRGGNLRPDGEFAVFGAEGLGGLAEFVTLPASNKSPPAETVPRLTSLPSNSRQTKKPRNISNQGDVS